MTTEILAESEEEISIDLPSEDDSSAVESGAANFGIVALFQVVMRTGWIFKTESIIMPAVLDTIGGPGWLRGCLPMLNRFGQSIPPVMASGLIRSAPQKKLLLTGCTAVMGVVFWALAIVWSVSGGKPSWWLPVVFLGLYAVFFVSTGINNLVVSTLIGKLIPVDRRGRLLLVANTVGATCAVLCAWQLLRRWLTPESAIFGFAGSCFLVASVVSLLLFEPRDSFPATSTSPRELFRLAARTLAEDANFRRLAIVASLFGMSLTLFPHYQALARQRLHLGLDQLMPWVIAQNVGMAVCSVPAGWLVDRFGNRLVVRLVLVLLAGAPLLALWLAQLGDFGGRAFFVVFCMLGLTPLQFRLLQNYCLELAPRSEQPRYLSTLGLCLAGPTILTSALLGGLVDLVGFEPVFLFAVACLLIALLLSRRLVEPRRSSQ